MIHASDLPQIKIRVLNFVRSNPGYDEGRVSAMLNVPINFIRQAVIELKREGLLQNNAYLRIGRRQS